MLEAGTAAAALTPVPPPQEPVIIPMPSRRKMASQRLLRLRGAFPSRVKPPTPKGSSNAPYIGANFARGRRPVAAAEALEIVRVEVAAAAPGVIVAGEKEQLNPLGTPLHESEIALLNDPD